MTRPTEIVTGKKQGQFFLFVSQLYSQMFFPYSQWPLHEKEHRHSIKSRTRYEHWYHDTEETHRNYWLIRSVVGSVFGSCVTNEVLLGNGSDAIGFTSMNNGSVISVHINFLHAVQGTLTLAISIFWSRILNSCCAISWKVRYHRRLPRKFTQANDTALCLYETMLTSEFDPIVVNSGTFLPEWERFVSCLSDRGNLIFESSRSLFYTDWFR